MWHSHATEYYAAVQKNSKINPAFHEKMFKICPQVRKANYKIVCRLIGIIMHINMMDLLGFRKLYIKKSENFPNNSIILGNHNFGHSLMYIIVYMDRFWCTLN